MHSLSNAMVSLVCMVSVVTLWYSTSVEADSPWPGADVGQRDLSWPDGVTGQDQPGPTDPRDFGVDPMDLSQLPDRPDFGAGSPPSPFTSELLRVLQNELGLFQDQPMSWDVPDVRKKFKPSGFMGSRGKRFLPGLESLILARYYQDAKWKRQPHSGFHGSRG